MWLKWYLELCGIRRLPLTASCHYYNVMAPVFCEVSGSYAQFGDMNQEKVVVKLANMCSEQLDDIFMLTYNS